MADIFMIAFTFFLRLGLPLLLVVGGGYLLVRYLRVRAPTAIQAPPEADELAPAEWARAVTVPPPVPCWVQLGCAEERRAACPTFQRPQVPCWLAVQVAEGQLRPNCFSCQMYRIQKAERPVELRVIKGRRVARD